MECEEVADSKKLMEEKIDIGEGRLRTIGSGVRPMVSLAEMKKDAFIVVYANLKPRKLGPLMSEGMVMCATFGEGEPPEKIELLRPPPGSKLGERITLEPNPFED